MNAFLRMILYLLCFAFLFTGGNGQAITATNDSLNVDAAAYQAFFCAAYLRPGEISAEECVQLVQPYGISFQFAQEHEEDTLFFFSDSLYARVDHDPAGHTYFGIQYVNQGVPSTLEVPIKQDFSEVENKEMLIYRDFEAKDDAALVPALKKQWEEIESTVQDRQSVLPDLYLSLSAINLLYPGMGSDASIDFLQSGPFENDKIADNGFRKSFTHWIAASELQLDCDLYFHNEKLSCIIITVFPSDNHIGSFDVPSVEQEEKQVYIGPMFFVDFEKNWNERSLIGS